MAMRVFDAQLLEVPQHQRLALSLREVLERLMEHRLRLFQRRVIFRTRMLFAVLRCASVRPSARLVPLPVASLPRVTLMAMPMDQVITELSPRNRADCGRQRTAVSCTASRASSWFPPSRPMQSRNHGSEAPAAALRGATIPAAGSFKGDLIHELSSAGKCSSWGKGLVTDFRSYPDPFPSDARRN